MKNRSRRQRDHAGIERVKCQSDFTDGKIFFNSEENGRFGRGRVPLCTRSPLHEKNAYLPVRSIYLLSPSCPLVRREKSTGNVRPWAKFLNYNHEDGQLKVDRTRPTKIRASAIELNTSTLWVGTEHGPEHVR